MIKIEPKIDKYCSKCGKYELNSLNDICSVCGTTLSSSIPTLRTWKCDKCGEEVEAELEYFQENPICPSCKEGTLYNPCSRQVNQSSSFKIDGVWNGGNIGKKIQEKNEQLKKIHEGYSYENQNLREKINRQTAEIYGVNENR